MLALLEANRNNPYNLYVFIVRLNDVERTMPLLCLIMFDIEFEPPSDIVRSTF